MQLFIAVEYDVIIIGLIFFSLWSTQTILQGLQVRVWAGSRMRAWESHTLKLEPCGQDEHGPGAKMTCKFVKLSIVFKGLTTAEEANIH